MPSTSVVVSLGRKKISYEIPTPNFSGINSLSNEVPDIGAGFHDLLGFGRGICCDRGMLPLVGVVWTLTPNEFGCLKQHR